MMEAIDKFQTLLRELFQFDCADLDFGIYRMNKDKFADVHILFFERSEDYDYIDRMFKEQLTNVVRPTLLYL